MTESEALEELMLMVAADSEPTLALDEVAALLVRARRSDLYGLLYGEDGWTETWDLHAAAAEGWRRKAGKCSGLFDFSTDGQSFSRQQMQTMCLEMASRYLRGVVTSAPIYTSSGSALSDIAGNVNDA